MVEALIGGVNIRDVRANGGGGVIVNDIKASGGIIIVPNTGQTAKTESNFDATSVILFMMLAVAVPYGLYRLVKRKKK
ncbi:MAG: hypothetical protein VX100_07365 [Pseudomonadota bacterium]|nr:hypothetical protein [Pseudomonadota bacterium]